LNHTVSGLFWIGLYLLVVLVPMFLMLIRPVPSGRDFWLEFSVALGFVGLTQIALQFVLIARFRRVTAPYGIDIILQYHKQIAMIAVLLILAHPTILMINDPSRLELLNPLSGTWASRSGLASVFALLLITLLSVFRQRISLDYEVWRVTHALLAITALVFAQLHVTFAGVYINTPWKHALWIAFGALMVGLLAYLRLVKPALQRRAVYRVAEVREERGDTYTLVLTPDGHEGLRFDPGQFAWIKIHDSPYTIEEHPYSFSSSAERPGRLEFGIKVLGDFSAGVKDIPPGSKAYLDGPHGAFSVDRYPAAGYVFIAGGVGITPVMSSLRTLADRADRRPLLLFYAEKTWDGVAFREELEALEDTLDLKVVYVLEEPPEDWQGEEGFVTSEVLDKHLPEEKIKREFFVCGPDAMMDAVQEALLAHGVKAQSVHMERFNLV
jgi:predicted ferric reductase